MNPTIEIVCETCRKIKRCPYIDEYIRSGVCGGGHCVGWMPSIKAKREAIGRYEGALKGQGLRFPVAKKEGGST